MHHYCRPPALLFMQCMKDHFDFCNPIPFVIVFEPTELASSSILVDMYKCIIVTNWKVHNKLSCYYERKHCVSHAFTKILQIQNFPFTFTWFCSHSKSFVCRSSFASRFHATIDTIWIACVGLLFSLLLWMFWFNSHQVNSSVVSYTCIYVFASVSPSNAEHDVFSPCVCVCVSVELWMVLCIFRWKIDEKYFNFHSRIAEIA